MEADISRIDTELLLSLELDEKARERSNDLNVGYDSNDDKWELIVRFIRSIEEAASEIPFTYTELLNGYAIIRIDGSYINELSRHPNIIWIEKPNKMITEVFTSMKLSCIQPVMTNPLNLTGRGILIAVIDSGVDIFRSEFRNVDGSTKLVGFWNQSEEGVPPKGYNRGRFYTQSEINDILNEYENTPPEGIVRKFDRTGHGTAVCSIASSVAPEAGLLVVKLAEQADNAFPRTTELMEGIDFVIRYSMETGIPTVINISFGNNYGDHNANSLIEEYIDTVAASARITMVTGMGNDGNTGRHAQGLMGNSSYVLHEFRVSEYETGINIQLWKRYSDIADIFLITPSGIETGPFNNSSEVLKYTAGENLIAALTGKPSPFNTLQETFISIIPDSDYIEAGIWKIRINPKSITDGSYNIWLPVAGSTSGEVYFLRPSEFTTMTIPATADKIISVAAYDAANGTYAGFSGRGYTAGGAIKPDIAAPGTDILVAQPGSGYAIRSGTSFAAPFVSGSAALMMQWGIVMENDIYMYGERVKAGLIRGARRLPVFSEYPNPYIGWGTLCLSDSIII